MRPRVIVSSGYIKQTWCSFRNQNNQDYIKVRLHWNKNCSFHPITILITNQTKPPIDLACFDCLRETETALNSLAGNRTRLSSTGSELIEMECQQMKSNENKITTHRNGSFAVPFTMTIKIIVISNQDCFDGVWNALIGSLGTSASLPQL